MISFIFIAVSVFIGIIGVVWVLEDDTGLVILLGLVGVLVFSFIAFGGEGNTKDLTPNYEQAISVSGYYVYDNEIITVKNTRVTLQDNHINIPSSALVQAPYLKITPVEHFPNLWTVTKHNMTYKYSVVLILDQNSTGK